jgi:hypothetical protein
MLALITRTKIEAYLLTACPFFVQAFTGLMSRSKRSLRGWRVMGFSIGGSLGSISISEEGEEQACRADNMLA